VAGFSSASLALAWLRATEFCFCRCPVLLPLFPAGISNFFCLPRWSKTVCSLLLVHDAQCRNFLAILPANHFDFVSGTSASRLRDTICLKFKTEICSKGKNSLKSQNSSGGANPQIIIKFPIKQKGITFDLIKILFSFHQQWKCFVWVSLYRITSEKCFC